MLTTEYRKDQPESIQALFNNIAHGYDRGNALLSLCLHRIWNKRLVREVMANAAGHTLLDLCAGTGDIAQCFLNQAPRDSQVFLLDFSEEMLAHAKNKLASHPLTHYIRGDAQQVPLEANSVDLVTVAYGIRNVRQPERCIEEAFRVLKPGGAFGILELTRPGNPLLQLGHKLYLKLLIPTLGKWVTANAQAYRYLRDSIQNFESPARLRELMEQAGFQKTREMPLMGGISTIVLGQKI